MCNIPLHNVHAGSKQPLKCLHIHDCNGTEVKTRLFVKKDTKYQSGFWTQNTDLQFNPLRAEAPTETTETEIMFLISLCTVTWRNKINEIQTWSQGQTQKPNTHHSGIKGWPEGYVWQVQAIHRENRESAMRKQQRFSNFHLELHSSPCSWLLEFDCQLPNSCWVLNGCSLKHSPWHKKRTEKDDYKHRPPAYLNIWPPQQHRQRLLWVCW